MRKVKILFICKHGVFRSRVAEEYFRKINRNKNVEAVSRGIIMGGNSDSAQREMSKNILGVDIAKRKPISLTIPEMLQADMIIVVANDIPKVIFDYQRISVKGKVIIWKIPDEQRMNIKNLKNTVSLIKKKVDKLNKKLENGDLSLVK